MGREEPSAAPCDAAAAHLACGMLASPRYGAALKSDMAGGVPSSAFERRARARARNGRSIRHCGALRPGWRGMRASAEVSSPEDADAAPCTSLSALSFTVGYVFSEKKRLSLLTPEFLQCARCVQASRRPPTASATCRENTNSAPPCPQLSRPPLCACGPVASCRRAGAPQRERERRRARTVTLARPLRLSSRLRPAPPRERDSPLLRALAGGTPVRRGAAQGTRGCSRRPPLAAPE